MKLPRIFKKPILDSLLFKQYLSLYIIMAFVPVLLCCISLAISSNALKKEVIHSNQASLELIQQSLDSDFRELEDTLNVIEQDHTLTRYALKNAPFTALDNLEKYALQQDSVDMIMLSVHGEEILFSSGGYISHSDLQYQRCFDALAEQGYSVEDWLDLLNSIYRPTYWSIGNSDLFLFAPISSALYGHSSNDADQISYRTLVYVIHQSYIRDVFQSSQTNNDENLLLFNSNFDLISKLAPTASDASISEIRSYLEEVTSDRKSGYLTLDGNLVFYSVSEHTGLCYVRFLAREVALAPFNTISRYTFLILLLVIIVGFILITFSLRRSYRPIQSLADYVRANNPDTIDTRNELILFRQVFDDAIEFKSSTNNDSNVSKTVLIDQFLTKLIRGKFSTEEEFYDACKAANVSLNGRCFCVSSVLIESYTNSVSSALDFDALISTIRPVIPQGTLLLAKNLLFANKFLLLLNGDETDYPHYSRVVTDIKRQLEQVYGIVTSIGMGSICTSFNDIGKSYLESTSSLDYRLIYGKDCLITPDMCNTQRLDVNYPNDDLGLLRRALQASDIAQVEMLTARIRDYTKSQNCSLHAAKYICYDIFSILKKLPVFTNVEYNNELSETLNITHLVNFETVDEFFASLLKIVHSILSKENTKTSYSTSNLVQQIEAYIQEHCLSYDFQVSSVAEHFSVSPQYIRKIFKDHIGMSVSEYVSNIKQEKAMELLRETDMNLQSIVTSIGNSDVSGFVRSFKQKTGITPGQYRTMWKKQVLDSNTEPTKKNG